MMELFMPIVVFYYESDLWVVLGTALLVFLTGVYVGWYLGRRVL